MICPAAEKKKPLLGRPIPHVQTLFPVAVLIIQSLHFYIHRRHIQMAELTYIRVGDYYIPNLVLDPEPAESPKTVGKYGSLRRTYLKERRHELWRELAGSGKLTAHLLDIDKTASEWMDRMLPQMMKAAGVTEELKARNQMAWIGLVNNCKAQVEEIIFSDLIYV